MKTSNQKIIITFLCLLIYLVLGSACAGDQPISSEISPFTLETTNKPTAAIATEIAPTNAPVAETPSPIPASFPLIKIDTGTITDFWWISSPPILYYEITKGVWPKVYAYDPIRENTIQIEATREAVNTVTPTPIMNIPATATQIEVSPSGARVIYLIRTSPTATPIPDPLGGEQWLLGGPAELWLLENGKTRKIGMIEDCLERFIWSSDEEKLVSTRLLAACKEPTWLIDFQTSRIQPILGEMDSERYLILGFSPSGDELLYRTAEALHLLNSDSLESTQLQIHDSVAANTVTGSWLAQDLLLVTYKVSEFGKQAVGVYNLTTSELNVLFDSASHPALTKLPLSQYKLSSDGRWLAIATSSTLWVIEIAP